MFIFYPSEQRADLGDDVRRISGAFGSVTKTHLEENNFIADTRSAALIPAVKWSGVKRRRGVVVGSFGRMLFIQVPRSSEAQRSANEG